ncbi:class I SAM-dependent RNA methyltransferase, partial [bacterium]|nr:class I SAM-dependent RNA methyltransferase [bacterium]
MSKQRSLIVTGPITALSPKGTGVLQTPDGPVYVPHTTPGDRVSVQIIKYAATYRIGKLKTIHLPSTDRRTPHCPLSGRCGGCQLGHIEPIRQREFKMRWLRDWLNKNQLTPIISDIRFDSEVGYRNKLQLSIVKDHTATRLGLNRFHSVVVEPVSSCPVVTPEINRLIDPVREWVSQLDQTPSQVTIRSSNTGQFVAITTLDGPHWGDSELVESINGIHYRVSPTSFFQGNRTLVKQMIDTVIDCVSPTETTTGLDLFGGVGLFGLPLAKRSRHV